jgi:transposase
MKRSTTSVCNVTYAGVDYHKKFSVVTLGDKSGKAVLTERIANDRQLIRQFFGQYPGLICTVESCRGYEWFVELLQEMGLTVHICNPYAAKLIAQSRCKTDRIDSRILMELLAKGFLPTCYQPTAEERELRERLRWRCHLVRSASRIKVRIHSLLDKENLGLAAPKLFSVRGRQFMEQVKFASPGRQRLLKEHLKVLEQLEKTIDKENALVVKLAKASPEAQLLKTIPGIGDLSALMILAELGDISRFKRACQVVKYAGLVPSVYSSADTHRTGPITKQGPRLLRWIIIQDAWIAVNKSFEMRCRFAALSKKCGRKSAIVGIARRLLEIAFHVLKKKQPYDPQLVATGSARTSA